jgi:hypothetical protein
MTATTDPFFHQLSREWLVQYVQLSRRAPGLIERLREQTEEFELVPVPRALLNELAAEVADASVTSWLDDPRLLMRKPEPGHAEVRLGAKPVATS